MPNIRGTKRAQATCLRGKVLAGSLGTTLAIVGLAPAWAAIEDNFQRLLDSGVRGCPAVEVMVESDPTAVDEIVELAVRSGVSRTEALECATMELVRLNPEGASVPENLNRLLDSGVRACPAIEVMVESNPAAIDEIVDAATNAGIPETDALECAATKLAELGPAAGPLTTPGEPGDLTTPTLREPKIIRPNDLRSPPTAPDAASPS